MRNVSVISHHHTDYIVSRDQNTVSWTKHMLSFEIKCKKHPWSRTLNGLTNSLFRKQHTCVPIHQNNGPFTDLRDMVLWHTSFNLHPFVVNLVRLVIGQGSLAIRLESSGWWWIQISKHTVWWRASNPTFTIWKLMWIKTPTLEWKKLVFPLNSFWHYQQS